MSGKGCAWTAVYDIAGMSLDSCDVHRREFRFQSRAETVIVIAANDEAVSRIYEEFERMKIIVEKREEP